ncbi:MAG: 4Fe-4S binding protein, partial [Alistipes sp.]|nr:4Fe-4S binding protein [Alistipes sp.]
TQAIAPGDELHTDPQRCIRCCACVKGCPTGARSYETPFAAALSRNFSLRKPPVALL